MPVIDLPRRMRRQRNEWEQAARLLRDEKLVHHSDLEATSRPYLMTHPEREIAGVDFGGRYAMAHCAACDLGSPWADEHADHARQWCHAHNAERHPRRWLRSQHFQADLPTAVRDRSEA